MLNRREMPRKFTICLPSLVPGDQARSGNTRGRGVNRGQSHGVEEENTAKQLAGLL